MTPPLCSRFSQIFDIQSSVLTAFGAHFELTNILNYVYACTFLGMHISASAYCICHKLIDLLHLQMLFNSCVITFLIYLSYGPSDTPST